MDTTTVILRRWDMHLHAFKLTIRSWNRMGFDDRQLSHEQQQN
jgi:hypothetical protein